jgi:hypothetical protein
VLSQITERGVIPTLWPEARRDIGKLIRFMNAVALWRHPEPDFFGESGPVIIVRPSDAWLSMKIFGERLVMSALNVSTEDVAIVSLLRDRKSAMSVSKVKQLLADPDTGPGINLNSKLVRKALDGLEDRGYVEKDASATPVTYRAGVFAPQIERSTQLDWGAVIEEAAENVRGDERIPDETKKTYLAAHCQNPVAAQPFTGEQVEILTDDSFSGELAEAAREMEEVASKPMWGSLPEPDDEVSESDDDSDENAPEVSASGSGQVTLG